LAGIPCEFAATVILPVTPMPKIMKSAAAPGFQLAAAA
jgi:hypothetical protein